MRAARLVPLPILLLAAASPLRGAEAGALRVRASEAVVPCVEAAVRAYAAVRVSVERGGFQELDRADVFVASAVEMTRALESGNAVMGTEVDVATIPWVLLVEPGNPLGLRSLADLARPGLKVSILAGLAAYEARRAIQGLPPDCVLETSDPRALRGAPVALVPLSLAGDGERISVEVPPIVARAAVTAGSTRSEAAHAFVAFLGTEAGQRAFAGCGKD